MNKTLVMSFKDLQQKLAEIRQRALADQALSSYDALAADAMHKGSSHHAIDMYKLNLLWDRVSNASGDLLELYQEAMQFGVPEQKFMRKVLSTEEPSVSTQAGEVQKSFRKKIVISLHPRKLN
jgi:hypothetical protein